MSTVGAVMERMFRTYLYPPNNQPATAHLDGAITDSTTSITLKNFVLPEDEYLVTVGTIIEIGSELIRVTGYDSLTLTITDCRRGLFGTTAAAHDNNDPVLLSPPYPRLSVFEAVADNIITLYPKLWQVSNAQVVSVSGRVAPIDDDLAVEVIEAYEEGGSHVDARISDYESIVGGRALVTNLPMGNIWVKYRKRFGQASAESDTLADLGVEPRWANIVILGAAADLFAGQDLPHTHIEWVESVLQAENIPVGSRSSLSQNLASYRNYLLENAKKEMRAEYRSGTHMRPATQVRVRSPFG